MRRVDLKLSVIHFGDMLNENEEFYLDGAVLNDPSWIQANPLEIISCPWPNYEQRENLIS